MNKISNFKKYIQFILNFFYNKNKNKMDSKIIIIIL